MGIRRRLSPWQARLICTLGYATTFLLLREISVPQWNMLTALRLTALLLPCRYWGALLLGEALPLIMENLRALHQFGWPWFIGASVPPILLLMPLIPSRSTRLSGPARERGEHLPGLVLLAFAASLMVGLRGLLHCALDPSGGSRCQLMPWPLQLGAEVVGNFLPAVAFLPLILMIHDQLTQPRRPCLRVAAFAPLVSELAAALLLVAVACWWAIGAGAMLQSGVQLTLLLPVLWLAHKRGWHFAAIASAGAGLCMMLVVAARHDRSSLEVEMAYAFITTVILLLGARTSVWRQALEDQEGHARTARQGLYSHALKLRQSARALDSLQHELQLTHGRLLNQMRMLAPAHEERRIRRELDELSHLLESVSRSLAFSSRHGMPAAAVHGQEAGLEHALLAFGIAYKADSFGQLSLLPADVMTALSRLTCETMAQLILRDPRQKILVNSHIEVSDDGLIRIQLDASSQGERRPLPKRRALLAALGADGLSFEDIHSMARLFHGQLDLAAAGFSGTRASLLMWVLPAPEYSQRARTAHEQVPAYPTS
ncbi:hypothetical protein ACYJW8_09300 [Frateuria aurantia]